MATSSAPSPRSAEASPNGNAAVEDHTSFVLQPVAAPSILGLFGFAAATFIVSTNLTGWHGTPTSGTYIFPFASIAGGLAQLIATNWAYRARDGIATAVHGIWGSFWVAYGILWLLAGTGAITLPEGQFVELGYWFLPLAAITAVCAIATSFQSVGLTVTLVALATGAGLAAIYYLTGSGGWDTAAGYVLLGSAILAFYNGAALLLEGAAGRVVLPLGRYSKDANVPGHKVTVPLEWAEGEPGIRRGQ